MKLWPQKKHEKNVSYEEHKKLLDFVDEQRQCIERIEEENKLLHAQNEKLCAENAELKKQLGKDAPPPSTPSAMIPPYKKPTAAKRKKKPGRKDGHPGTRRTAPERIDETVEHTLESCPECGESLSGPVENRTRITEDIPPVQVIVTQHIIHRYYCPCCNKIVEPPVDAALPKMQIGIRALVFSVFVHYFLGVPISGVQKLLSTFCSFKISPGGLTAAWARLARLLKPLHEQLRREAAASDVLHADETGWRVAGKTWWLWCFTNSRIVYYTIANSRGSPVVADVLGKLFSGTLVCDFFGAYNLIEAAAKQRCLVHLFRELKKVLDKNTSAEWKSFCKLLKRILRDAMRLSERIDTMQPEDFKRRRTMLDTRLAKLCSANWADKDCRRLVKRLSRCKDELFVFVDKNAVAADNNHAERQIRPAVVMRKNSYGNRSAQGAETQAVLMSLFRTLHMRGLDPVETLCSLLKISLLTGSLPPLPAQVPSLG
jgi:transposase